MPGAPRMGATDPADEPTPIGSEDWGQLGMQEHGMARSGLVDGGGRLHAAGGGPDFHATMSKATILYRLI